MTAADDFKRHFADCPLIAIIRGVRPEEAAAIGEAIHGAGIRIIEVPLNSPDPVASIRILAETLGNRALIGAGTVLKAEQVQQVADAGGRIIVSPGFNAEVIRATVAAGLVAAPGFFTPTEGFAAVDAGAHALKLFPAEAAGPEMVKSILAVLPRSMPLIVVGGVRPDTMQPYLDAGADGFGLGGGLYKPGQPPEQVAAQARAYVEALPKKG